MPICPYCEEDISIKDLDIEEKALMGVYHKFKMYSCSKCKKILGFSESWGE